MCIILHEIILSLIYTLVLWFGFGFFREWDDLILNKLNVVPSKNPTTKTCNLSQPKNLATLNQPNWDLYSKLLQNSILNSKKFYKMRGSTVHHIIERAHEKKKAHLIIIFFQKPNTGRRWSSSSSIITVESRSK